jgi:hypothetical protein
MDLVRFVAGLRLHSPEAASTVNVPPIGNEKDLRPITRPHRADLVVHVAVVIARERTDVFGSELLDVAQVAILESSYEDVKVTLVGSRNKR